jgi:uncharacterized protein (TIGR02646 family)
MYISKFPVPQEFSQLSLSGDYKNIPNVKKDIKILLLKNQNYRCCYCQDTLNSDGSDSHIEHLIPQSSCTELSTQWFNLFAVCHQRMHCDDENGGKGGKPIPPYIILHNCEEYFGYAPDGKIYAQKGKDEVTEATIKLLNLNHNSLIAKRLKIYNKLKELSQKQVSIQRLCTVNNLSFAGVFRFYCKNNFRRCP